MLSHTGQTQRHHRWGITVEAIEQGKYDTLEDSFIAAVQSGDLPDLATGYTNAMANRYAVDAGVDLTSYTTIGKATNGSFFAFPISQSANVIFYNSQWAQELGFANPPTNLCRTQRAGLRCNNCIYQ